MTDRYDISVLYALFGAATLGAAMMAFVAFIVQQQSFWFILGICMAPSGAFMLEKAIRIKHGRVSR